MGWDGNMMPYSTLIIKDVDQVLEALEIDKQTVVLKLLVASC